MVSLDKEYKISILLRIIVYGIKSKSDGDLQLESTGNKTSKIMPTIEIRENSQYRITMDPSVINNTKDPDCYIEGKIVVEKNH